MDTLKKINNLKILIFASLLFIGCRLDGKYSNLRACNQSYNSNYEDVITNIYISNEATNDNFVSVWNGKLGSNQSTLIEIDCGNYGVKFSGTRSYNSGIEKPIEVTTGYKTPIRFAAFWTFRLIYDGKGLVAEEED